MCLLHCILVGSFLVFAPHSLWNTAHLKSHFRVVHPCNILFEIVCMFLFFSMTPVLSLPSMKHIWRVYTSSLDRNLSSQLSPFTRRFMCSLGVELSAPYLVACFFVLIVLWHCCYWVFIFWSANNCTLCILAYFHVKSLLNTSRSWYLTKGDYTFSQLCMPSIIVSTCDYELDFY